MSRLTSALLFFLFIGFITAPAFAVLAGVQGAGTALQNRNLAKKPQLTLAAVWDRSYGKEFSDWIWDTIPLRDKALKMDHTIDYYWFHDSPTLEAFFGKEGFAWRRERVLAGMRAGQTPPADLSKALDRIERAFKEAGVPVYVVVSPTKASIYPEYLPDAYREVFEKTARPTEDFLRKRAESDSSVIDLWAPMLAEKQRLLQAENLARPEFRYLWRRNDDHWNVEAGRIQAREIVKAVEPGLWDEAKAPIIDGQFEMRESELSVLYFKLGIEEPYQSQKPSPLTSISIAHKRVKDSTNPIAIATSSVTPTHTPSDKTVLVIRDSFLAEHSGAPSITRDAGVQTIAPFFKRTLFMHWETMQKGKERIAPRMRGIDAVVVQVTQGSNYYLTKRASELVALAKMIAAGKGQTDDGTDPPEPKTPRKQSKKPASMQPDDDHR